MNASLQKVRRGFTLVEVLVVVSIISLLSSVALASLGTYKARADESTSLSDAKTINEAVQAYDDSVGLVPPNPPDSNGKPVTSNDSSWSQIWTPVVTAGFLNKVPYPKDSTHPYAYYKFNSGQAVFIVHQETPDSSSCHPFSVVDPSYSTASCAPTDTHPGDANSDGRINGTDFSDIDAGYNAGLSGWKNGDFDCDGRVTFADYAIINAAYVNQSSWNSEAQIPTGVPISCTSDTQEYCVCLNN